MTKEEELSSILLFTFFKNVKRGGLGRVVPFDVKKVHHCTVMIHLLHVEKMAVGHSPNHTAMPNANFHFIFRIANRMIVIG